jgi:hypothetical protein
MGFFCFSHQREGLEALADETKLAFKPSRKSQFIGISPIQNVICSLRAGKGGKGIGDKMWWVIKNCQFYTI